MRLTPWLSLFSKSPVRRNLSSVKTKRRSVIDRLESLEDRTLLTVSTVFSVDTLTINLGSASDHAYVSYDGTHIDVGTSEGANDVYNGIDPVTKLVVNDTGAAVSQTVTFSGSNAFTPITNITVSAIETSEVKQAIPTSAVLSGDASIVNVAAPGHVQDGVDLAASGATVNVGAGTYNEQVAVEKTLTLLGAQHGVDARTGRGAGESIIDGSTKGGMFDVRANNVVIDGFTLTGDASVSSNVGGRNAAISLFQAPTPLSGFQALNNIIYNVPIGIGVRGDLAVIQYNLIRDAIIPGASAGAGVYSDALTNGLVDNNKFVNTPNGSVFFNGFGTSGVSGIQISNNQTDNSISLLITSNIQITGNTITSPSSDGIAIFGGDNGVVVDSNTITNPQTSGAAAVLISNPYQSYGVAANSNVTITNNILRGTASTIGVKIDSAFVAYNDVDPLLIRDNDLSGNGVGILSDNSTAMTVDASRNYWASSNPTLVASKITGANSGSVDYSPLIDNNESNPAVGFQPNFSSLTVHSSGVQVGSTGRINEAVGPLTAGGTINIVAGTYTEDVVVNKSLTLDGSGTLATDVKIQSAAGTALTVGAGATTVSVKDLQLTGAGTGLSAVAGLTTLTLDDVQNDATTGGSITNVTNLNYTAGPGSDVITASATLLQNTGALPFSSVTLTSIVNLVVDGAAGNDTINVTPSAAAGTLITANGGANTDTLNYDALNGSPIVYPTVITETGKQDDNYATIENISLLNVVGPVQGLGTAAADTFGVRYNGGAVEFQVNSGPWIAITTGPLVLNGGGGNDHFTLDMTGGNAIPTGGLFINGEGNLAGTPGDVLQIINLTTDANYTPSALTPGNGTVDITGAGLVTFTGLEPVDFDFFGPGNFTLTLPDIDNVVNVANGATLLGALPALVLSGTTGAAPVAFESAHVHNAGTLTIDTATAGVGADTITINSADNGHGNDNLVISTGADAGDLVKVLGNTVFTGSINVTTDAMTSTAGGTISTGTGLTVSNTDAVSELIGVISGAGTLTKQGAGTLALSGNNTFSGATSVAVGTLAVKVDNGLGTNAAGTSVAAGAVLDLQNVAYSTQEALTLDGGTLRTSTGTSSFAGTVALNTAAATIEVTGTQLSLSGKISGTQAVSKIGAGTLILSNNTNDYSGATNVDVGVLAVTANNALGTNAAGTAVAAGAVLDVRNTNYSTTEALTLNGGTLRTSTGTSSFAGTVALNTAAATIEVTGTQLTVSGKISGTQDLNKIGAGTLILTNSTNDYSGVTNVNNGTLAVTANNALGTTAGNTVVAVGGTLDVRNTNYATLESLSLNGGTLQTSTGTSVWTGTVDLAASSTVDVAGSAQLTISGQITGAGASSMTKTSGGVLFLTNANNTYDGVTNISAGTLFVTGNNNGAGAVNANGSSILGGTGLITGNVNINATAHLAPGVNGPGRLTITNSLTFATSAFFDVDLNGLTAGTEYDQVVVTLGDVDLGGADGATMTPTLNFGAVPYDRFTIIDKQSLGAIANSSDFDDHPEGSVYNVGARLRVSYIEFHNTTSTPSTPIFYGDGNDVSLTVMTPPILVTQGVNGDLTIDGTGWNDDITLSFTGTNQLTIIGNDVSNFTGPLTTNVQLAGPYTVTGNITVKLGNGKDKVLIRGAGGSAVYDSGDLSIDLGSDDDAVTTIDTSAAPIATTGLKMTGNLSIIGGAGTDNVTLGSVAGADTLLVRDLTIDTGAGNAQTISLDRLTATRNVTLTNGGSAAQTVAMGVNAANLVTGNLVINQTASASSYTVGVHNTSVGGFLNVTNGSGSGAAAVTIDTTAAQSVNGATTITNGNNLSNAVTIVGTTGGLQLKGSIAIKNGTAGNTNGITITDITDSGNSATNLTNGASPANTITFSGAASNTFLGLVTATNGASTGTNVINATRLSSTKGINLNNGTATTSNTVAVGGAAAGSVVSVTGNLVISNGAAGTTTIGIDRLTTNGANAVGNVTINDQATGAGGAGLTFGANAANSISGNLQITNQSSTGLRSVLMNQTAVHGRTGVNIYEVGTGDTSLIIGNNVASTIDKGLVVQDGTGSSTVNLQNLTVGSFNYTDLGGGTDTLDLAGNLPLVHALNTSLLRVTGVTRIDTGAGSDTVRIGTVGTAILNDTVFIALGSGNDLLFIGAFADSPAFNGASKFLFDGGAGDDTFDASPLSIAEYSGSPLGKKVKSKIMNFEHLSVN